MYKDIFFNKSNIEVLFSKFNNKLILDQKSAIEKFINSKNILSSSINKKDTYVNKYIYNDLYNRNTNYKQQISSNLGKTNIRYNNNYKKTNNNIDFNNSKK